MLVFVSHPTLNDMPLLVVLGRRAGAKLGSEMVKVVDIVAVTGIQVILAGAIHAATVDAAPGFFGFVGGEFVLGHFRQFRPRRPLSDQVDLGPVVFVFEVYFVGIVYQDYFVKVSCQRLSWPASC